jgi:hypothetical protein
MKMYAITEADVALLREYICLDVETGILRWKKKSGKKTVVGAEAGCLRDDGYKLLQFMKRRYVVHRVVYALIHGSCDGEIDHINRNPADNRPSNLRAVSRSQQNMNRVRPVNSTGFSGVYKHKGNTAGHVKVFAARIKVDGKYKSLGYYETAQEAHGVYLEAVKLHHGEYAIGAA